MRRSAGLLLGLFIGHLSLVASGAVCVVPGMAPMSGAVSAEFAAGRQPMAGMVMDPAEATSAMASMAPAPDGGSPERSPCSGPASGSCASTMPCITALGADGTLVLASSTPVRGRAQGLTVLVPASPGAAPELPPPRA